MTSSAQPFSGAGTMGGGIAMSFANAGIPVTLVEQSSRRRSKRGIDTIAKNYDVTATRGAISAEDVDKRIALISGST